jgi:small subunit ribosomal protein S17
LECRNGISILEKYAFSPLPPLLLPISQANSSSISTPRLMDCVQHFNQSRTILVHDPRSSLRIGDVISISPGWRASKQVHHVVNSILAPFGEPIEARPPVPTPEERIAEREAKRKLKELRRRAERRGEKAGAGVEKSIAESENVFSSEEATIQEIQAVKGDVEAQLSSGKSTEESGVSKGEEAVQEVREEGAQEVKEEEQSEKPKGWWRL